jgi:glutamate-1-semialdehyde 2,1-aminomutase
MLDGIRARRGLDHHHVRRAFRAGMARRDMSQFIGTSEALFERACRVSPGGVHSPVRAFRGVGGVPRFIREAQGCRITDVDGNSYIDFCMSWGPLIFGHQDPDVRDAAVSAVSRGWSYGTAEAASLDLAELITVRLPWVEKIRFVNSGTEAVMSALRVARAATGRSRILKFEGCYHGHVDSMLVKAGSGLAEMARPDSAGIAEHVAADTLVAPLDNERKVAELFERHEGEVGALIIEPLPANYGLLIQRAEFLRAIVDRARAHGALVILDEVISGFRVAFGGMAQLLGIAPDLVTYGKVIGGGFPVGAYGGRAALMDLVAPMGPVYQAGTLSANPVAMAAGLATLRKLDAHPPYAALEERTRQFCAELSRVAVDAQYASMSIQQSASLFWPVLGESDRPVRTVTAIPALQRKHFATLFHALLERGVYLAPSGFEVGFLSTAHADSDLEQVIARFREALADLRR